MLAFRLGASNADAIDHALQAADEIVISSFGLALVAFKRLENDLDAVDGGENERDSLTRGRRAVAKLAHQRFGCMCERFEARQPEKPASAFDAMDQPEDVIENLRVVRVLLKTHELDVDHVETLVRLGYKFPQQVVHKKRLRRRAWPVRRFPLEARPVCR